MRSPQKRYKHIALFSLSNITQVCDIIQDGGLFTAAHLLLQIWQTFWSLMQYEEMISYKFISY